MKNVLICILSMLLSAAAFLSRPTERDFQRLVLEHEPSDGPRDARLAAAKKRSSRAARAQRREPTREREPYRDRDRERERENPFAGAEFLDRLFWVEVRKDGKTVYAGCFSHWWDRTGRMMRV
jgi:hypothetical protein